MVCLYEKEQIINKLELLPCGNLSTDFVTPFHLERKQIIIINFMLPLSRRIIVKVLAAQQMPQARFLNKPIVLFGDV